MTRPSDDTGRVPPRRCEGCGTSLKGPRGKRYCHAKCRALAHRVRKTLEAKLIVEALRENIARLEKLFDHEC